MNKFERDAIVYGDSTHWYYKAFLYIHNLSLNGNISQVQRNRLIRLLYRSTYRAKVDGVERGKLWVRTFEMGEDR